MATPARRLTAATKGAKPKASGLRIATSDLVSRSRLARAANLTFNGRRDYADVLGYPDTLTPSDYRRRYERSEIASRVVEALPLATWRGDGELVENEDPTTETAFEAAWNALSTRLNIWAVFRRADILAGLGQYAVILLGAPGALDTPLGKIGKPENLIYLQPFAQDDASIATFETNEQDPRCTLPLTYDIKRLKGTNTSRSTPVHWTRVIHLADGLLDDSIHGRPRLQNIWNRLDDLDKVVGGGAEAFWLRANQGMQLAVDPEIPIDPAAALQLEEQVEEYSNQLRRILRTRGVDIKMLGSDVANFAPSVESLIGLISAGTGIPQRILMGSERGELASSQDRENWNERVQDRRDSYAEPFIVRPFVQRLIEIGALPEPVEPYEVRWPAVRNLTMDERVAMAKNLAGINQQYGDVVVLRDEIRDWALEKAPITDEQKAELEVESPPRVPPGAPPPAEDGGPVAAARRRPHAIPAVADRFQPQVEALIHRAFTAGARAIPRADLIAALEGKHYADAERALSAAIPAFEALLRKELPAVLLEILIAGGQAAVAPFRRQAKAAGLLAAAGNTTTFNTTNPRATEWSQQHAAELVTNISETTRKKLRLALTEAFTEEKPPRVLARDLVGIIDDPARAELIALTEVQTALHQGQAELWRQAIDRGDLTGLEQQEWIVTADDRLCTTCAPMEGQVVGLEMPFTTGDGDEVYSPPAHARCRCTTGISARSLERRSR